MNRRLFKISICVLIPVLVFICSCERLESNRAPVTPFNPYPQNGAIVSEESVWLSWQCTDPDGDVILYNVYFGDSASLATEILDAELADTAVLIDQLEPGQTYFWSVVAVDDYDHIAAGPIWSFSVDSGSSSTTWNPLPADSTTDQGMDALFSWEFPFDSAEGVTFDFYCGLTSDPPLVAEGLTIASYDPGWSIQFDAVRTLADIHLGELEFFAENGSYWGQGTLASKDCRNTFSPIGIEISANSIYDYTITTACQSYLLVTASTCWFDLEDPAVDSWTVDAQGVITCTSNDADVEFVQLENYHWKIVARDNLGRTYESPVWSFSTGIYDQDGQASVVLGIPYNPVPANQAVDVSSTVLQWSCDILQSGFIVYDLYLGQNPDPPLFASELYSKSYDAGHLQINQTYYWRVVARNGHDDISSSEVWSFDVTDNYPPDFIEASFARPETVNYEDTAFLNWAFSDADGDDLSYDLYFGTEVDPLLVATGLTETSLDAEWSRQMNLRAALLNIYTQQILYWGAHGSFWGEGLSASAGNPDNFSTLGTAILPEDPYVYTIQIANDSAFEITAEANFDLDGDLEVWKIDKNCFIQCISHDSNLPVYQTSQTVYWKIAATDGHGNRTESPVNSFSTWPNRAPSVIAAAYPAPGQENIPAELTLKWHYKDLDGDSIVYDVYFDTTYYPPRIANGISDIWLKLPLLENGQYYYWTVVPRNPGSPQTGYEWPDYFWVEP